MNLRKTPSNLSAGAAAPRVFELELLVCLCVLMDIHIGNVRSGELTELVVEAGGSTAASSCCVRRVVYFMRNNAGSSQWLMHSLSWSFRNSFHSSVDSPLNRWIHLGMSLLRCGNLILSREGSTWLVNACM